MQIDGLIPFKSSIDQVIASLYFLKTSTSFYSLCSIKSVDMIIGFDSSASKKAYLKYLSNSFRINPLELVSTSFAFPSQQLDFYALHSFRLSTVSLI